MTIQIKKNTSKGNHTNIKDNNYIWGGQKV